MSEGSLRPEHIGPLDGIRGLAILLVLTVHLHWLGFGWIGVQLFFVLSGFLITRILLRTATQLRFRSYLADFYVRRVLRIFPLYFGYIAITAIAAYVLTGHTTAELPYVLTFTRNLFKLVSDAQMPAGQDAALLYGHFWSLCVEEHFYLFWPLLIFLLRRHVAKLVVALILLGPVIRAATAILWPSMPHGAYELSGADVVYLLSTSHIDAFATGAALCLLPAIPKRWHGAAIAAFVVALLAAVVLGWLANHGGLAPIAPGRPARHLGFPEPMPNAAQYVWGYSLLNLLGAGLLWLGISVEGFRRVFTQPWLTYTGRISYGMYVLHFPLLMLPIHLTPWLRASIGSDWLAALTCQIAYVALVYLLASISFRWYESPFLRLKSRWKPGALKPAEAVA